MSKETSVVLVTDRFAALQRVNSVAEVIRNNIGANGTVTAFDLERIKIPSGGGPAFVVEDALGEADSVKQFEAVIVAWQDRRALYLHPMEETGSGTPPDCSSEDMVTGHGALEDGAEPGEHECRSCPHNQWGSAFRGGRGKQCKELKQLFVLRQGNEQSILPSMLVAPPTSLKSLSKYMLGLASHGINYFGALHRFSLLPEKNADGVAYAKIKIDFVRVLSEEETRAMQAYNEKIGSALTTVKPVAADVVEA
jgi:hypothetical protein